MPSAFQLGGLYDSETSMNDLLVESVPVHFEVPSKSIRARSVERGCVRRKPQRRRDNDESIRVEHFLVF